MTIRHESPLQQVFDVLIALVVSLGGFIATAVGLRIVILHIPGLVGKILFGVVLLVMGFFSIMVLSGFLAAGIAVIVQNILGRSVDDQHYLMYRLIAVVALLFGGFALSYYSGPFL